MIFPKLQIRKSDKDIEEYYKFAPIFGEILFSLYKRLRVGKINSGFNLIDEYNLLCKSKLYDKCFYTCPFIEQTNHLGQPFGHPICISKNDEVAHGFSYINFNKGDIISIDCGLKINNLYYDAAFTVAYYSNQPEWIIAPQKALQEIKHIHLVRDIAKTIKLIAEKYNLEIVNAVTGHGIGYSLHEYPPIYNSPINIPDIKLIDNLIYCAEPIYIEPDNIPHSIGEVFIDSDNWTIKTTSGKKSTHWETMFLQKDGKSYDLVGLSRWEL